MQHRLAALLMIGGGLLAQRQEPAFRLPEGVDWKQNVVYSRAGGRELTLDLFLPASGAGPFPAVVYVHGGGWSGGNKSAFRRQAAHMAARGFAGACIEYRLSGEAPYPAALHDTKAAVRWLRANAGQYRVDPDRIGTAGGSAGGHLVAMLGVTGHLPRFEGAGGHSEASSRVQAVAAFNPAVDLVSFGKTGAGNRGGQAVSRFLRAAYAENPELWAEASPLTHAGREAPPFLLLHGTADQTVPYRQSADLMERLRAAGVAVEMFTAEGAGHGFFNRPPFFEPTLRRMEEFFRKTLQ
jgi:acetyl esterase/lipase